MNISQFVSKFGIIIALIILVIFFSFTSNYFFTPVNIFNILRQVSFVGICAVGMTFIMLTAGIDLSVGSIIAVSAVLTASLMTWGISPLLASIISLFVGTIIGLFNGFIINVVGIPPLITTLGMMTTLRGVAYLITGGLPVYGFPESFTILGQGYVWIIPIPVIIMIIVFLVGYITLEKTIFGRHVYGVGGNEEAARLSGVSVKKIVYLVYSIGGFLASLTGIVLLSRVNSGQPRAATGYELDIITAVVLGGISITGGVGSIIGVIAGVLIMGVLINGMILLNVNEYFQWVVKGLVLLGAVGFDKYTKNRKINNE